MIGRLREVRFESTWIHLDVLSTDFGAFQRKKKKRGFDDICDFSTEKIPAEMTCGLPTNLPFLFWSEYHNPGYLHNLLTYLLTRLSRIFEFIKLFRSLNLSLRRNFNPLRVGVGLIKRIKGT